MKVIPVILQMRLYALYGCSKKLLVFMAVLFAAEVGTMLWILIATNLLGYSSSIDRTSLADSDLRCRSICRSIFPYRTLLQSCNIVCCLCRPCVRVPMGSFACFRRGFGCTCSLGWDPAFKTTALRVIGAWKIAASQYPYPRECDILY